MLFKACQPGFENENGQSDWKAFFSPKCGDLARFSPFVSHNRILLHLSKILMREQQFLYFCLQLSLFQDVLSFLSQRSCVMCVCKYVIWLMVKYQVWRRTQKLPLKQNVSISTSENILVILNRVSMSQQQERQFATVMYNLNCFESF